MPGDRISGKNRIQEVLKIGPELDSLIQQGADSRTIESRAVIRGFVSLKEDGQNKVAEGITSAAEIRRVL